MSRSDAAVLTNRLSPWLLGDPRAPLDLELARLCGPIAGSLVALQQLGAEVLGRMHEIAVGPGTVIHNCVPHPTQGHPGEKHPCHRDPEAAFHQLQNPDRPNQEGAETHRGHRGHRGHWGQRQVA